jgi:hypothetical protein
MNSEFKPHTKKVDPYALQCIEDESYRVKLLKCAKKYPEYFMKLPTNTTYRMFVERVNHRFTRLIETDCREIFRLLDPLGKGVIDGAMIIPWAETGRMIQKPEAKPPIKDPILGVKEAAINICGKNIHVLENCFNTQEKESMSAMTYETFYRLLREGGLGKDPKAVRDLYLAISGDISVLYKAIPIIREEFDIAAIVAFRNKALLQANAVEVVRPSAKPVVTEETQVCIVDRKIRDGMRKTFRTMKSELENIDHNGTGFIEASTLFTVISKLCCPITPDDFRIISNQVKIIFFYAFQCINLFYLKNHQESSSSILT